MVMAAWGCTAVVERGLDLFTEEAVDARDGAQPELEPGTWAIYSDSLLDAAALTVSGPDGAAVPIRAQRIGVNESVSRGSNVFVLVARFEVDKPGVYSVEVIAEAAQGQIIVARPLLDAFAVTGRAAGLVVMGLFVTVAGMVLWYRRTRTRTRTRAAEPSPPSPGPGIPPPPR